MKPWWEKATGNERKKNLTTLGKCQIGRACARAGAMCIPAVFGIYK